MVLDSRELGTLKLITGHSKIMSVKKNVDWLKQNWCNTSYILTGIIFLSIMWLYIGETIMYRSLLLAVFLIVYFCGGKVLRVVTIFLIMAMVLFECHFILHYRSIFWGIGDEILIAASLAVSDDVNEIFNYFKVIKTVEYAAMTGMTGLTIVFAIFMKPSRRNRLAFAALPFFLAYCWFSYGTAILRYYEYKDDSISMRRKVKAHSFSATGTAKPEKSLLLMVVGESQRQDHYSYMINRKYAPLLWNAEHDGNMISFTDTTTHSTKTLQACVALLTRASTEYNAKNFYEKSLISAYKEAGYSTYYITYHPAIASYNDGLNIIVAEAGKFINHAVENRSTKAYDTGMLPIIDKIIKENKGKTLIVMKTISVHFPFYIRFPKEFELFTPTTSDEDGVKNKEMVRNNYRNGIVFSGYFLNQLATYVSKTDYPAAMVFISDHGAALFDDGKNNYFGSCKGNYHIPFFIYGTDAFWKWRGQKTKDMLFCNRKKSLTTDYFFESMLDLMSITYPGFRSQYNLCGHEVENVKKRKVYVWNEHVEYDSLANDTEDSKPLPMQLK
jgi:glucan phosphoethanolaminetransferase (alkaline phosphatase superfamily)